MTPPTARPQPLTFLFTCVGRRIELIQAFRASAKRLGVALRIIAADGDITAPGLACADAALVVPRADDPEYIPILLDLIRRESVLGLIPTIDTDLRVLSEHRGDFEALGCTALIGDPGVIGICRDKLKTFQFLQQRAIDTPETYAPEQIRTFATHRFPYFLKPRFGSASAAVHKITDMLDLDYFLTRGHDPIVQEFVVGQEYTLDAYVGLRGDVRCVVPRLRWQVRSGEVSKGVVVKDARIMEAGRRVVEELGPSLRGVVTLQCIVTADQRIRFIEINPRFGGGAPLSIAAGADFPGWLIQEMLGGDPRIAFDGFQHGLCMLRYDWAAFLPLGSDLTPGITRPIREFPRFE